MSKTFHRQIGKLRERGADEAEVGMIIKSVADVELAVNTLLEYTRRHRDSWLAILDTNASLINTFYLVFSHIPRPPESAEPAAETPEHVLERIKELGTELEGLRNDMRGEVEKIERTMILPLAGCKDAIKPMKKAIDRRENKKLDYERWVKAVEGGKGRGKKTDKDYAALSKAEMSLESATTAYEAADDHLKSYVPPILAKIIELFPMLNTISIEIQFTLLQHTYSTLFHFASAHGYEDRDAAVILEEWQQAFLPLQADVERELKTLAYGKAVTMPMAALGQDNSSITSKLTGMASRGRMKPPPPPPPASAPGASPLMNRPKSSGSLRSRMSMKSGEPSPPLPSPPVPTGRPSVPAASRPSIRSHSTSNLRPQSRDDSPPPPLPGPRPTLQKEDQQENRQSVASRAASFGGQQATVLAGLRPSQLKSAQARSPVSLSRETPPPAYTPVAGGSPSPAALAAASSQIGAASKTLMMVAGKKKPPPPPPKKKFVLVRAVYDFEGQDAGDLSFKEGDRIKVVKKTESTDDWWEGELNGRKGSFPANYVELM